MKYVIADTYCKAGGAGMGYHKAGFKVVGIDIEPQPNYPFEFIQCDAIEFIEKHRKDFDAWHASPPCQYYSVSTIQFRQKGKEYKDLIEKTRKALKKTGRPSIMENVPNSPVRPDLVLYGYMFGLKLIKKRLFEIEDWFCLQPGVPTRIGTVKNGDYAQVVGKGQLKVTNGKRFNIQGSTVNEVWSKAMGIDWMTNRELAEAIPPPIYRIHRKTINRLFNTN